MHEGQEPIDMDALDLDELIEMRRRLPRPASAAETRRYLVALMRQLTPDEQEAVAQHMEAYVEEMNAR